jgi:hypothetical protein
MMENGMLARIRDTVKFLRNLDAKVDKVQKALGRIETAQSLANPSSTLQDHEFQVFSQWGEDGILQFLLSKVEIANPVFVEFGVENYTECNTRFLLQNNRWAGLILDGSEENMRQVRQDPVYWRYNLKAVAAFIDKDNINSLIRDNGIKGDIGLLSVDIDGNDYWVWEAIDCINPRLVVCEYNSVFGPHRKVSTPYDKSFIRSRAHHSNLYYGASIAAFDHLAKKKGYALVGSNSAGNNVFFVRKDLLGELKSLTPQEAYVKAHFRESRDAQGTLTLLDHPQALSLLGELPLVDVETGKSAAIREMEFTHA